MQKHNIAAETKLTEKAFSYSHPTAGPDAFDAWAAYNPKDPLKPFKYDPRPLGEHDIEVKITHCGICFSDIHQIDNGWGGSIYPMVPGHEIVGIVAAKGSKVTGFNEGDRVGVGVQVLACASCHYCTNKLEQYCGSSRVFTYNSKYPNGDVAYGGYAKRIRAHEHFTFKIPDSFKSAEVAPMFCAGATVYEPLKRFGVGKGHKVGIIGIGGLGHLAIQFAAALGADVTAISTSATKKDLAFKLGAKHFICTPEEKKAALGTFDYILTTDNGTVNITDQVSLVKPLGHFIIVGLNEDNIVMSPACAVMKGLSIHGSMIASPSRINEMLQFASDNNIVPYVQEFDIDKLNEVLDGVRAGKPRFRYVLKIQDA